MPLPHYPGCAKLWSGGEVALRWEPPLHLALQDCEASCVEWQLRTDASGSSNPGTAWRARRPRCSKTLVNPAIHMQDRQARICSSSVGSVPAFSSGLSKTFPGAPSCIASYIGTPGKPFYRLPWAESTCHHLPHSDIPRLRLSGLGRHPVKRSKSAGDASLFK